MLFANPIWLFALAAVGIPVIIHLWNIKPGKKLKVGSIALFIASSPTSSRSFKLSDILLLLTRCLLLMLLALLLTVPLWKNQLNAQKTNGWLLISRGDFKESYQKYQPKIDSLIKSGYEFHLLENGFSKKDINEFKNTTPADTLKQNYWLLLKQLADQPPPKTQVELFTPNTVTHFTGERPATHLKINWHTYTPADSVATWPAAAWLMPNGKVRVLQGTSIPAATGYQYQDITNGQGDAYRLNIDNGLPYVNDNNTKIAVDTATTRMAVYADKTTVDAGYLTAALKAVEQLTGRNTVIKIYSNADLIPTGQNWIFWLSVKQMPSAIITKTKNVFVYQSGKIAAANTSINNTSSNPLTQGNSKISLYKIIPHNAKGNAVWTDGFGNAILIAEHNANLNTYHFYSRFNPSWNDLVWSDEFPAWMMALTQPNIKNVGEHERRVLSDDQIKPTVIADDNKTLAAPAQYLDLTRYLWLALMLIFIVERWLATKNQSILKHD